MFNKQLLALVTAALYLTGCATLDTLRDSITAARAAWDKRYYEQIIKHAGAVSIRADTLMDKPFTVVALKQACLQGRFVEVFAHVNDLPIVGKLKDSCVRVVLTSNRQVLQSPTILILDGGFTVLINGQETYLKSKDLEQELRFREMLRQQAAAYSSGNTIRY